MKQHSKQAIHGVVLLDKPSGMSSNKALQIVKRIFNAKKAGHTGSLDPLATGLLPICLGQATKASEYCLKSHKQYQTVIKLGEVTDTLDSDGEIVEVNTVDVTDQQIESALEQFRGDIQQVPPMYSALKKDGQPLYKLARKGDVVEREPRDMTVYSLEFVRIDELHLQLDVHCSSGFYIRSLAHDLGQLLGCGAHVTELRRIKSKDISVEQAFTLDQLENLTDLDQAILPIDTLLQNLPTIQLTNAQADSLQDGKITTANGLEQSALCRFYRPDGQLFGVGVIGNDGRIKTHKIFMLD